MIASIFGFLLVALALLAMALQRFYSCVPARELKRLASRGDHLARQLYRPVAYGASLRLLLWIMLGICMPVGFLLLGASLPTAATLAVIAVTLAVGFIWLPSLQLTVHSARFAVLAAPILERVLHYTHTILDPVASGINRYRTIATHSGLFEKEDLHALLDQQKAQADNRIVQGEIDLLQRALQFSDRHVSDVLVHRKDVRLVDANEHLGPVLMDELHNSGSPSFLVYEGQKDHIVGTLFLRDVVGAKQGGKVAEVMRRDVCYVNEAFSLPQVLEAFIKTKHYVAVVVNNFEEFVGIITLESLLHELAGAMQSDEDLAYENRASIASYQPKVAEPEPATQPEAAQPEPQQPSPDTPEVVE
ncbi:MAG TPA: CBS domain-containing protein [Nevskiaceae bacterium]|nr:CBS domain-containing protein [Nevskiaceae bacterium]